MKTLPVSPQKAMQMVSNMHIVPATPNIAQQIKQVRRGDLVRLQGELVEIKDRDLVWRSSLTNTDVGEGGCELFRVKSIQWIERKAL
jgi:acyl-coenzyme A thioesterase PaaI-like protein